MKFLAIIDVAEHASLTEIRAGIREELLGAWSMFAEGTLIEAYATDAPSRIVFILDTVSREQAAARLQALPLIKAGLIDFQLIALRPFVNWSVLFAG